MKDVILSNADGVLYRLELHLVPLAQVEEFRYAALLGE